MFSDLKIHTSNHLYFSIKNRFWNAYSDQKFGYRGGDVSYTDARKKGSGTPFQLAFF
jgi:hypothetical protein